ncbi:hypothetical protein SK128_007549 [Halocaridina rubra]|uniref:BHLH domain-containing protein n=1 Tax=Halocaridina rubra TaxID=373956 RepID=A0AAN9FUZ8_HALRR
MEEGGIYIADQCEWGFVPQDNQRSRKMTNDWWEMGDDCPITRVNVGGVLLEMLACRALPTVPEEEFLPEVGPTPEIPPSSVASSGQQQPSPASLHYTARLTANSFLEPVPSPPQDNSGSQIPITASQSTISHHHQSPHNHSIYRPPQMPPLEQQSRQLVSLPTPSPPHSYHHQSPLVRHQPTSHQSSVPLQQPPTPLHQLSQPLTPPLQLSQPLTPPQLHAQPHTPPQQLKQEPTSSPPHLHQSPRSFIRSQSQHELNTQQQQVSHSDDAFVIPKLYPRRRSHSSGGSSSNNSGVVGVSSLVPHQVVTSVTATSLSHLNPSVNTVIATSLPHLAPAPAIGPIVADGGSTIITTPVISPVQAASAPGGSALLAQLLTSGSCQVSCSSPPANSHQLATFTSSGQLATISTNSSMTVDSGSNVKVSLMIPGVITGNTSTGGSVNSSSSTLSCITSNSGDFKPGVSTPVLVSPITLSAVTPSTLKTQSFSQISPWSPCSPKGIFKQSPPHPEPSSPLMMNVPSPPNKAFRPKSETERVQYKEHRRVCHINAEQKRRSNLKNNFDIMHSLIPSISQSPNAKISKAAMLHKGAEYIQQLKTERQNLTEQAESLRAQIENLSQQISNAQAQLPATGAPMTHARHSKLREMFTNYVRERTLGNWKFWIFSLITESFLESYNNSVSTNSVDDLCRSSLAWLDQQCSLNILRPLVSNSMRKLSTTTNVLEHPDSLPEEVYRRVTKQEVDKYCSHR